MPKIKYRYRLRELMYSKYGKQKFATACIIVAQWINFEHRNQKPIRKWSPDDVQRMASSTKEDSFPLTPRAAEAIRQLFGLQSTEEIFND